MSINITMNRVLIFMTNHPGWHDRTEIYAAIPDVCTCEINRNLDTLVRAGSLEKRVDMRKKNRLEWKPEWRIA